MITYKEFLKNGGLVKKYQDAPGAINRMPSKLNLDWTYPHTTVQGEVGTQAGTQPSSFWINLLTNGLSSRYPTKFNLDYTYPHTTVQGEVGTQGQGTDPTKTGDPTKVTTDPTKTGDPTKVTTDPTKTGDPTKVTTDPTKVTTDPTKVVDTTYNQAWVDGLTGDDLFNYNRQKLMYGDTDFTGYSLEGENNGGLDSKWSDNDAANWKNWLKTNRGTFYGMSHNDDGTDKKLTNQQLLDNFNTYGTYYTDAQRGAYDKLAAIQKENNDIAAHNASIQSKWKVGDKTYTTYADYKAALDEANNEITKTNKILLNSQLNTNLKRAGANLNERRDAAFTNLQGMYDGSINVQELTPKERRDMNRMIERARRRGGYVAPKNTLGYSAHANEVLGRANFYNPTAESSGAMDLLTDVGDVKTTTKTIDGNAVSYKRGGLLTYSDYLLR